MEPLFFSDSVPPPNDGAGSAGTDQLIARGGHKHPLPEGLQLESFLAEDATTTGIGVASAGQILVRPVYVCQTVLVTKLRYRGDVAHASSSYCFGVYDGTGRLVLTTDAIQISTGLQTVSTIKDYLSNTQESIRISGGLHFFAHTANSTTAKFYGRGGVPVAGMRVRQGTHTGGGTTLPATITPSSITDATSSMPWFAVANV